MLNHGHIMIVEPVAGLQCLAHFAGRGGQGQPQNRSYQAQQGFVSRPEQSEEDMALLPASAGQDEDRAGDVSAQLAHD